MKVVSNVFSEYLQKFSEADALYNSLYQQVADFALSGVLDDEDWDSLKARMSEAKQIRDDYAVVFCRVLSDYKYFESAPENASADAPADVPKDASEDSPAADPVDVSEDSPAADSVDAPEDIFPVMSAKCRLCPSCVDGRCFFVPDVYDSEFPCQSPAWDNFFKSGGSHGPAP